jgi:hypothetical protein
MSGRTARTTGTALLLALKPMRASRHISDPDLGGGADVA